MPETKLKRRSGCPVSMSLEILGDRWSLLIVRDMMVRGHRSFKQFQESGEGIATNILADRLEKLTAAGLIHSEEHSGDKRRREYRLTEKGIDLAPVVMEIFLWGARNQKTGAPPAAVAQMAANKQWFLDEARRRWERNDPTPLLPRFQSSAERVQAGKQKLKPIRKASGGEQA